MEKKVVIIGAGLGGLECGVILARKGFHVTVLERHSRPGGAMQTFVRRGPDGPLRFDCGFHYVGGLREGESLERLFSWFGLMDLPWRQLDPECFDDVTFTGDGGTASYPFANGHDRFAERLGEYFPHEREGLRRYVNLLRDVGDHIFDVFDGNTNGYLGVDARQWLRQTISDPRLRSVLSGTALKMELRADSLPLYTFAQINDSYIRSAWRLEGGGDLIPEALATQIRDLGGEVICGREVEAILSDEGRVTGVRTSDGEVYEADYVVSDIHPATTAALAGEAMRKMYRRRVSALENTCGFFTANIALKPEAPAPPARNFYVHRRGADLWRPDPERTESVLVHFYPEGGRLDIMSPMSYPAAWKGLPPGRRGPEYEALKAQKAEECISLASARLPWIREAAAKVWTSTPLTWEDYTGTPGGSAYGIRKDFASPELTVLPPRTPLGGLYLTGQNLTLHGLLGVSMTAVLTCSQLLGDPGLGREIVGK